MKKFIFKLVVIAVLAVATIVLAVTEIKAKGTITGLTLIPFAIMLCWCFGKMVASDLNEFIKIYAEANDE